MFYAHSGSYQVETKYIATTSPTSDSLFITHSTVSVKDWRRLGGNEVEGIGKADPR